MSHKNTGSLTNFARHALAALFLTGIAGGLAHAGTIFSTNFEDVTDWSVARPTGSGIGFPASWTQKVGGPNPAPPRKTDGSWLHPNSWTRVAPSTLSGNPTPMASIGAGEGRDASKGMTYNVEVTGTVGVWSGGSPLNMYFGTTGYPELYVSMWLQYDPAFTWLPENTTQGSMQKLVYISRLNAPLTTAITPDNHSNGLLHPSWLPHWTSYITSQPFYQYYINRSQQSNGSLVGGYNHSADMFSANRSYYPQGTPYKFPESNPHAPGIKSDGQWHHYLYRVRMNSAPGVADGVQEVWLDGVLQFSKKDMIFVLPGGSVATGWNYVQLFDNANVISHPASENVVYPIRIDDVVISTEYLGLPAKPVALAAAGSTDTSIKLQWAAGSNGASYKLSGYRIYYTDSSGVTNKEDVTNVTAHTVTGLSPSKSYKFEVTALNTDAFGAVAESLRSASVTASTSGGSTTDSTNPVASISAPASGTTVSGTTSVTATASDNIAVSKVELYLNGFLHGTKSTAPYTFSWNTLAYVNGPYTLLAKAYDSAGNVGQGTASVTVNNSVTPPPPSQDTIAPAVKVTSPAYGTTLKGIAPILTSATDNVAVTKVEFLVNGNLKGTVTTAPFTFNWNTVAFANGAYSLQAKAYDAAGNAALSSGVTFYVANSAQDTIAPTVKITSPAYGTTLKGIAPILTSATDNVAVTKVEFLVNGNLKGTVTTAPFTFNWNTLAFANGAYSLRARAYDAAGNVGLSAGVTFYVANGTQDTIAPVITLVSPATSTVSGRSVQISASATDNVGVTKMELYVDGALVLSTSGGSLSTQRRLKVGTHVLVIKAYDAAGNIQTLSRSVVQK